VTNTGNEVITNFEHVDIFTCDSGGTDYVLYTYDQDQSGASGTWTVLRIDNDLIHPGEIDPGETAWFWASFSGNDPVVVQVTTNNGVTAQLTAPIEGWR
jgi:flagellar protein FlaF